MGSIYVSSPVFHASCETQDNYVCTSRIHTPNLSPMPSIQKMARPMGAKMAGAMFDACLDLNQPYTWSLFSSSSPSAIYMLPASPTSILASKHLTKLPSSDLQPPFLAINAHRAAPINALHSSPSASNSTNNDCKAPLTLSEQWRQIQGEKHWEGLLDHPINATLRAEIIRYGEFAQVCYDAFDFNQHSLYCGSCKYNRRVLFEKVDKGGCGYEVTKYLYATSKLDLPKFFRKSERKEEERWSCDSNWIGYVAVCTDEDEIRRIGRRDILIAWRGTVTTTEWVDDLMTTLAPANIELARNRPLNSPLHNAPSRIQNADAALAESCHNPFAHIEPQDAGSMNVKAENNSGVSNTAYQLAAHRQGASTAYIVDEKNVNKEGKAEKDAKYNATAPAPARRDRPAPISNEDLNEVVKVESGFLSLYSSSKASSRFNKLSAGQQMAMEVKRLLQKYEGEEISISITGHSLGAALALLCAYDIAANVAPPPNITMPQSTTPSAMANDIIAAPVKQGKSTITASPISSPTLLDKAGPNITKGVANPAASSTSGLNEAVPPILGANQSAERLTQLAENTDVRSSTQLNVAPTRGSNNIADSLSNGAAPPEVAAKRTGSSPMITVYSFAGPRVGNRGFKRRLEEVGVRVLRIVNVHDCVPKVPGVLFNEHSPKVWPNTSGYHHVGKELLIDFDFSPHLRQTRDLASHHNLEAHLHVLDGFHGFTRPFQSVFRRNPVLVNKSSDFLQRGAFIPPNWWQESNKGLVKDPSSGQWVLSSREDDHMPEIHHP